MKVSDIKKLGDCLRYMYSIKPEDKRYDHNEPLELREPHPTLIGDRQEMIRLCYEFAMLARAFGSNDALEAATRIALMSEPASRKSTSETPVDVWDTGNDFSDDKTDWIEVRR